MTDRDDGLLLRLAQVEERSKLAFDQSTKAIQQAESVEQRLKSIQHRVDNTEGKLDTMLDKLAIINNNILSSNATARGIQITLKVVIALISVVSTVTGLLRLLQS